MFRNLTANDSRVARSRPIELLEDEIQAVSENIQAGKAFLKGAVHPWGVEFQVCDNGEALQ